MTKAESIIKVDVDTSNPLVDNAVSILDSALNQVAPHQFIPQSLKFEPPWLFFNSANGTSVREKISSDRHVFVFGAGKASAYMAEAVESLLGDTIHEGFVIAPKYNCIHLKNIKIAVGGHPLPDQNTIQNTLKLISLLKDTHHKDLVIFLISGGGSSMLEHPQPWISLVQLREIVSFMIKSGANIRELNRLRTVLSTVKGGRLSRMTSARKISLIVSDVIGDPLSAVASGPTVPGRIDKNKIERIIQKYELDSHFPKIISKIREYAFLRQKEDRITKHCGRTDNLLVCNNQSALHTAREMAEKLGYRTQIISTRICGDVGDCSRFWIEKIKKASENLSLNHSKICLLGAGEPTVRVKGSGKGGRNQELTLRIALQGADLRPFLFVSLGTDGFDGNTMSAGALWNHQSTEHELHDTIKSYLKENNSHEFFKKYGGRINTGETGTNVMDLHMVLVHN